MWMIVHKFLYCQSDGGWVGESEGNSRKWKMAVRWKGVVAWGYGS